MSPDLSTKPQPRLGNLLSDMIKAHAARQRFSMKHSMEDLAASLDVTPDAVYRWRRDAPRPSERMLRLLLTFGVQTVAMDRQWAEAFVRESGLSQSAQVLGELFPQSSPTTAIVHNLPRRSYQHLVGREIYTREIMQRLAANSRHWIVPIEGVGGIGKSALALDIGWHYIEEQASLAPEDRFDHIVWVSAKRSMLTFDGIISLEAMLTNLDDIHKAIAEVLPVAEVKNTRRSDRVRAIYGAMRSSGRVLLIIDNLEMVTAPQDQLVIAFLRDLPSPAKAVVATRAHDDMPYPLRLGELSRDSALALVRQEGQARGIALHERQIESLLKVVGGFPLAIWWAIGLIAVKATSITTVLSRLQNPQDDLLRFIFKQVVSLIEQEYPEAYDMLLALSFFDQDEGAAIDALASVADIADERRLEAVQVLQRFNIVSRLDDRDRLTILPLTRLYVQATIKARPGWEDVARARWIAWYLDHTRKHGTLDWQEWDSHFGQIESEWQNFLRVFEWCASAQDYKHLAEFWLRAGIVRFTQVYGHWQERIEWFTWLIEHGQQRGHRSDVVESMSEKILTLVLMGCPGDLEMATALAEQAWDMREQATVNARCKLANHVAALSMRQGRFADAARYAHEIPQLLKIYEVDAETRIRREVDYRYRLGMIAYSEGNYAKAMNQFERVIDIGEKAHRQRFVIYSKMWMAEIHIVKGDLEQAKALLTDVLPVAERNKDLRRTALCQHAFARLEEKRGNRSKALGWAELALAGFSQLNMCQEKEEAQALIQALRQQKRGSRSK